MSGTPTPQSNIRRIEHLEADLRALVAEVRAAQFEARPPAPRYVRLAKTWTATEEDYPDPPANTFPILFIDGSYPRTSGEQTATLTDRQAQEVEWGHFAPGYIPRGTLVAVLDQNGQYWILGAAPAMQLRVGKTNAAINKGASGSVSIYDGAGSGATDSTEDENCYNRFADLESGKWVIVATIAGENELVAGEC